MEKPNNSWFTPAIATATAALGAVTLKEQQLTRATTEKIARTRQPLLDEKKAKRQLKAVLEVRSGIKQGTMSCEEGLEYCHRLGIPDPKKCLGEYNNRNQKRKTDVLLIENNFQPEDSWLDINFYSNRQEFTADCCDEDEFSTRVYPSPVSSPLV